MSIRDSLADSGDRFKVMIGMLCGVRKSKLIGFLKNIDYFHKLKLTILGVGINSVGKMR